MKNISVSFPYVEFDVTARTDFSGVLFYNAEIALKYNAETFGSNLVTNQNVVVTKEEIISNSVYSLNTVDETSQKIKISINTNVNPNPNNLFSLSAFENLLCHVKLKIQNPLTIPDLSFDHLFMDGKSQYIDPQNNSIVDFKNISLCNDLEFDLVGFTFDPPVLRAGVGDVLTITADEGFNFGSEEGYVLFRNTEIKNENNVEAWGRVKPYWVAWNPDGTKIEVTIPMANEDPVSQRFMSPGSGEVKIELSDGTTLESGEQNQLDITYSIINDLSQLDEHDAIQNLEQNNGNDGYVFHLGKKLHNTPNARAIIEKAMCDWTLATGVNFTLSPDFVEFPMKNMNDGLNTIFLAADSSFFTSVLLPPSAETFQKQNRVSNSQTEKIGYVSDIDIAINDFEINWHYSFDPVHEDSSKIDFYSAIIHEIGHAHSQWHSINPKPDVINDKLMYPFLETGVNRRLIDNLAEQGGEFIMNTNSIINSLPTPPFNVSAMIPLSSEFCINSVNEVIEVNSINIFPNPSNSKINIEYRLLKSNEVMFSIVNTGGKEIYKSKTENQQAGEYTKQLALGFPNGIYFLIMKVREKQIVYKIIKTN